MVQPPPEILAQIRERKKKAEEADGGEGSPGEAQGGGTQQTDTGNEGKTQVKDRTLVSICVFMTSFFSVIVSHWSRHAISITRFKMGGALLK